MQLGNPKAHSWNQSMASIFANLQRTVWQKSDLLFILMYHIMHDCAWLIYIIMTRDVFDPICLHLLFRFAYDADIF